jgi:hypothetical protein
LQLPTATPAIGDALEGGFFTGLIWNQVTQSATSTTIGTGSKTFTVTDSAPLFYSGQAVEVRSRANPSTARMIGTVTGSTGTTLTVNVTSVDGSGTLTDWSVMAKFRVIVAPKSSGENTSKAYKNARTRLQRQQERLLRVLRQRWLWLQMETLPSTLRRTSVTTFLLAVTQIGIYQPVMS